MSEGVLFEKDRLVGSFTGFAERGLEFVAELVVPYRRSGQVGPQMGRFVLVKLEGADRREEAVLGRITKFIPAGMLTSSEGENYAGKMQKRDIEVPGDLKERMLKYRVQIKLLGVLRRDPARKTDDGFRFVPSQRRLPQWGAYVYFPPRRVMQYLCGLGGGETNIGRFALAEFVYSGKSGDDEDGFTEHLAPEYPVTFDVKNLVARRTAVFARAGYGKSNLIKGLVGALYEKEPKTDDGRPVGTLIFDADGEYFWPAGKDRAGKDRPGLCDVPHLKDKLAVFTNRPPRGDAYDKWTAGGVKLDLRGLKPHDVLSIALSPERQEQQNVRRMMSRKCKWADLVDLAHKGGYLEAEEAGKLLGYASDEDIRNNTALINAAINNIGDIVRRLHDPGNRLADEIPRLLGKGGVVVVDLSMLSASAGEHVAGLLLRKIFSKNQEMFASPGGNSIPVVAVIEEAQRVLGGGRMDESSPFVEWVKEGRKYDLGAILVTQQPGAISGQLLSQVDNWFCFHLLSQGDAAVLGKYNSHFSDDILAHMVAEPIVGNCFMWSAPHQPFVLPVRIRNFDEKHRRPEGAAPDAPEVSRKQEIDAETSDADKSMAEALSAHMREKGRAVKRVSVDDLQGIKDGQLYHLIREIKPQGELRHENDLKMPLFRLLFPEAETREQDGEVYFCAPKTAWEKVLAPAAKK